MKKTMMTTRTMKTKIMKTIKMKTTTMKITMMKITMMKTTAMGAAAIAGANADFEELEPEAKKRTKKQNKTKQTSMNHKCQHPIDNSSHGLLQYIISLTKKYITFFFY